MSQVDSDVHERSEVVLGADVVGAAVVVTSDVAVGTVVVASEVAVGSVVVSTVVVGAWVPAGTTVVAGVVVSELPPHPEATDRNANTTAYFLIVPILPPLP